MTDDIVTRLRQDCDTVCKYATRNEFTACDKCEAADEIERLRQLGDSLAFHIRNDNAKEMYDAVHQWEEARNARNA